MAQSTSGVYLSLGSNMGDRMAFLSLAMEKLNDHAGIEVRKVSKIYETEPWSANPLADQPKAEKGQHWFLNQAVEISTTLDPDELLEFLQSVESELGRTQKGHNGPREIDIDILLFGSEFIESDHLTIPHRHMNDRQFVLVPLVEISPQLKDPFSGKLYKTILQEIDDDHKVIPFL